MGVFAEVAASRTRLRSLREPHEPNEPHRLPMPMLDRPDDYRAIRSAPAGSDA